MSTEWFGIRSLECQGRGADAFILVTSTVRRSSFDLARDPPPAGRYLRMASPSLCWLQAHVGDAR